MTVDTAELKVLARTLAEHGPVGSSELVASAADELDELRNVHVPALERELAETRARLESAEGILRSIKDHPYHQCMATIEAQAHFARYGGGNG